MTLVAEGQTKKIQSKKPLTFPQGILLCDPASSTAHTVLFNKYRRAVSSHFWPPVLFMGWHLHARTHAGGEGDTAVHPVRTHCSTTALCQKGIAAGCCPGFSS